jgi:hypothetical protein
VLLCRARNTLPSRAILYIHGGGFIGSTAEMTDATCIGIHGFDFFPGALKDCRRSDLSDAVARLLG